MILKASITLLAFVNISFAYAATPNKKVAIPGEYIVKVNNNKSLLSAVSVKKSLGNQLFLIKTENKSALSQFSKVYPNYQYIGKFIEEVESEVTVDDADIDKQIHHNIIGTRKAWNATMGNKEIIVAVTDNEFQINHPDLVNSWYTNPNEIPENGIDDDNNGYIDDVYGWDFINGDNDVNAYDGSHGTHIAGIIAAEANNGQGGTGIAPNVKVMPLRWYSSTVTWTSAVIAETYLYAINMGAHIISTSYGIDTLVDDQLYRDVVTLARSKGILIFNSAGNANRLNPERQKIDEVILVCSVTSAAIDTADIKSSFSNYGTGIDICAPGDPIYSTVRRVSRNQPAKYAKKRGTSMAAPAAAAVAALIWSAHPNFTDEEVKQRLFSTADSIEDKNPEYTGLLGVGRINAAEAVK